MYIKNKSPNRTSFAHFHAYGRSQKYKIPSTIFILFFYLKKKIEVEKNCANGDQKLGCKQLFAIPPHIVSLFQFLLDL